MPNLVVSNCFGEPSYAITYHDGGTDKHPRKRAPNETVVAITEDVAALGLDACATLYESGHLK